MSRPTRCLKRIGVKNYSTVVGHIGRLDDRDYAKGIKVTDAEMAALNIQPADFHGEWNYTNSPRGDCLFFKGAIRPGFQA
jgi:hypothetical protein